jgi:PKD domain
MSEGALWRRLFVAATVSLVALGVGVSPVAAATTKPGVPVPTAGQLSLLVTSFDSFNRSGLINSQQVAASLRGKLARSESLLAGGDSAQAQAALQAFDDELIAQTHEHVIASASSTLDAMANGAAPPTTFTVAPTTTTVVATVVSTTPVTVTIPPSSTITAVSVVAPSSTTTLPPPPPNGTSVSSLVVTATDSSGQLVTNLTTAAPLSSTFTPPPLINPHSAVFTTFDPITGAPQPLPTTIVANPDGTFTATASTPHFSTFTVNAGRPTVTSVAPVYGPTAGGTTVQVGGFSLQSPTNVLFNGINGTNVLYQNNTLTAVSPGEPAGPATIQVVAGGQVSDPVNAPQFTYYAPLQATASIFSPPIVYTGDAVTFNAFSTGGYGPVTFAWTFADAGSAGTTAGTPTATHTYLSTGTFSVTVQAKDSIGNLSNVVTLSVTVVLPTLGGTVTDASTHLAIAGVPVEVDSFKPIPGDGVGDVASVATATTGSDGKWSAAVANGNYKVHFLQTNQYASQWLGNFNRAGGSPTETVNGAPVTGLDAAMAAGFQVSGVVTPSATGTAAGNVVTAYLGSNCCVPVGSVTTAADGSYSVTVPNGGSYVLDVLPPPGDLEQFYESGVGGGTLDFNSATRISAAGVVNVTLVAGDKITGTVVSGSPLAAVPFTNVNALVQGAGGFGATTDDSGAFAITVPKGGQAFKLKFNPPKTGTSGSPAPIYYGGGTNPLNAPTVTGPVDLGQITLPAGFRVYGTMTPGVSGDLVQAFDSQQASCGGCGFGPLTSASADSGGHYSLVVPAGSFIVHLNANQLDNLLDQWYQGQTSPGAANAVTVSSADVQLNQVTLQGATTITGKVENSADGSVVANLPVGAAIPGPGGGCCPNFVSNAQTNASGIFTLEVPPGTFIVFVDGPEQQGFLSQWIGSGFDFNGATTFDTTGGNVDITGSPVLLVKGVPFTGYVRDKATNAGIPNVNIGVSQVSTGCCGKPAQVAGGQTDSTGFFNLVVPSGSFQFNFNPQAPYLQDNVVIDTSVPANNPWTELLTKGQTIAGRVLDSNGNPVNQGFINIQSAGGCCFGTGAGLDNNGNYSVGVPPGSYIVSWQPPPGSQFTAQWFFHASSPDAATAVGPADNLGVNFDLTPGFTLSGVVSDYLGKPAPNVNVTVYDDRGATVGICCGKGQPGLGGQVAQTQTDGSGSYSMVVPANGSFVVQFDNPPPGNLPIEEIVTVNANPTNLPAQFTQGTQYSGTVTAGGVGVPGVPVQAFPTGAGSSAFQPRFTSTGPGGSFSLTVESTTSWIVQYSPNPPSSLAPAWYNGTAAGATGPSGALQLNPTVSPLPDLSVQLAAGQTISGFVYGADNPTQGLANTPVQLIDPVAVDQCCQDQVAFTQTDGNGFFSFVAPLGQWLVQAGGCCNQGPYLAQFYGGDGFDPHTATPVDSSFHSIAVTLPLGVTITGTVLAGGNPLGGVNVGAALLRSDGTCCGGFVNNTQTDPSGNYSLLVPSSPINVAFDPPPGSPWLGTSVNVTPPTGPVNATLQAGVVITGTVTDSRLTAPSNGVANVGVVAYDLGRCCSGPVYSTTTSSDGSYQLTVAPGNWSIEFLPNSGGLAPQWWDNTATGSPSAVHSTPVNTGGQITGINASLVPGVTITGHVGAAAGPADLPFVTVSAQDPASVDQCCVPPVQQVQTDIHGAYTMVVPTGSWLVNFQPDPTQSVIGVWYSPPNNTFDPHLATLVTDGGVNVDATLPQGFPVTGRITIANSNPVVGLARVNVSANLLNADGSSGPFISGATTDVNGNYSILLPAGSFELFTSPPAGYVGTPTNIAVSSLGAVTGSTSLALQAGSIVSGRVTDSAGNPVTAASVQAFPVGASCCQGSPQEQTDANGNYQLTLPNGSWIVQVQAPASTKLAPAWYSGGGLGTVTPVTATSVPVSGPDVGSINVQLVPGTVISGFVSNSANAGVSNVYVTAGDTLVPCCYPPAATASTDFTGHYAFVVADSRSYNLGFNPRIQPVGYLPAGVGPVAVDGTGSPLDEPVQLNGGYEVMGTVTGGIQGVNINAFDATQPCCARVASAGSDANGNFAFMAPAGGTIAIEYDGTAVGKTDQWYNGTGLTFATATRVPVTGPVTLSPQGV